MVFLDKFVQFVWTVTFALLWHGWGAEYWPLCPY